MSTLRHASGARLTPRLSADGVAPQVSDRELKILRQIYHSNYGEPFDPAAPTWAFEVMTREPWAGGVVNALIRKGLIVRKGALGSKVDDLAKGGEHKHYEMGTVYLTEKARSLEPLLKEREEQANVRPGVGRLMLPPEEREALERQKAEKAAVPKVNAQQTAWLTAMLDDPEIHLGFMPSWSPMVVKTAGVRTPAGHAKVGGDSVWKGVRPASVEKLLNLGYLKEVKRDEQTRYTETAVNPGRETDIRKMAAYWAAHPA